MRRLAEAIPLLPNRGHRTIPYLSSDESHISEDDEPGNEGKEEEGEKEELAFGSAFVEQYENHLDEPNPWHPDLRKPLFPS